jgi:hypothetical protein
MFCKERWGLIEASTKSGKTVSAMAWLTEQALMGQAGWNYWWVAPGYSQAEIAFRRIKAGLTKGSFTSTESPTPRITVLSGAVMWFKSGDNADALYGEDVYAAVIDEASRVTEPCWHAVRSTLTATRGPCRIIGNVKGRKNWFFTMARQAEGGASGMHYAKITVDDAVAAGVLDPEEIEDARRTLPEAIFRELYYAEPGDDTGNPFGAEHIRSCLRDGLGAGPAKAFGIDLAKSIDYLVVIGLNNDGEVCAFHRWRGVPWRESIRRIWKIVGDDAPALVDSTGVGDPVLEELQHGHQNFIGYHFSPSSKQRLMEGLAVAIQGHEVRYPDGPIRIELDSFEYEITKTAQGRTTGTKYAAAIGYNDDCVCALALARQMWSETAPGEAVMEYYARVSAGLKEKALASPPKENVRPWRLEDDEGPDIFDRELVDLYNETINAAVASNVLCAHCGDIIAGPTRVSDGFATWHVACARGAPKKEFMT